MTPSTIAVYNSNFQSGTLTTPRGHCGWCGSSASTAAAASCGIWAFLESTEHRDAKLAYESLFSRCLGSGPISVSLFFPLFISLFNLHCVCLCAWIISRVTCNNSAGVFQSLLLLCRLLFILRSSEFVSVAVSQLFSVLEMELPWFPSLLK